jgi:hypothetical protein
MISAILAFITSLPALVNGANAFASKYFDTKAQLVASRLGADVNVIRAAMTQAGVEAQARVAGLQVIASSKVLLFLVVGFALPFMIYEWQCIVYDKVWMHGLTKTDPIIGNLADWGQTIIVSLFGSGTAVTMTHMYFNRNKTGE